MGFFPSAVYHGVGFQTSASKSEYRRVTIADRIPDTSKATDMHDPSQPSCIDPADIAIARDEGRQRRRVRNRVAVVSVGLLVGYVLSPGPLIKLLNQEMLPRSVQQICDVYWWPLHFAYENVPVVKRFYDSYFHLFGVDQ
jgi:hypothetical protein